MLSYILTLPTETLQTILWQLGEAYFSIMRQLPESSNAVLNVGDKDFRNGSKLLLYATVVRLGGARHAWLVVLVVLLLGLTFGMMQILIGGKVLDFEAQDSVKLLQSALQNEMICEVSRICYKDGKISIPRSEAPADLSPQQGKRRE